MGPALPGSGRRHKRSHVGYIRPIDALAWEVWMRYLAVMLALLATTTGSSPLVAQQRSCADVKMQKAAE